MRQLSTSRDIQLKGKIQCLLSSVLPLNHRTGLNISGRFNVQKNCSNMQTFEQVNEELKKLGSFTIRPEEYKLYNNFWSLQKVLANPHQLFQTAVTVDLDDLDIDGCEGAELSSFDIIDQEEHESDALDDFVDPNK
jgi:hypothetical protein